MVDELIVLKKMLHQAVASLANLISSHEISRLGPYDRCLNSQGKGEYVLPGEIERMIQLQQHIAIDGIFQTEIH